MLFWRRVWVIFLALNALAICWFWWQGASAQLLSGDLGLIMIAVGRFAGLAAALAVLVQFFVMSRIPWLERLFGLDKLSVFHHLNGRIALPLLLAHPLFVVFGYGNLTESSFGSQVVALIEDSSTVLLAIIGLVLFAIVAVTSLYFARRKFRYESWYFVHLLAYLAVFFSFWHQIEVGSSFVLKNGFYLYWITLYAVTFGAIIFFRVGKPLLNFAQHQFTVDRLVEENDTVTSVYITGRKMEKFKIQAGQFMIFRFLQRDFWWEAHPFSMSMAPSGREIRMTVKAVGDFTEKISQIEPGTKVVVEGPYGVFTDLFSVSNRVLMIAGGIGITPLRSLAEEMVKKGKDVILLYGCRDVSDLVLKEELDKLAQQYSLNITYIVDNKHVSVDEFGHIDKEKIIRLVPDIDKREVFLCGPVPMMRSLLETLSGLGVERSRVHFERFSLH